MILIVNIICQFLNLSENINGRYNETNKESEETEMMPETIPDIRSDMGFKKDAENFAEMLLKNKRFRAEDFFIELKNLLKEAYMQGGQSGFNTGWRIKEMETQK